MQNSSELKNRLHQHIQELSPPLLQMVLEFVEFLLGQQHQLQVAIEQNKQDMDLLEPDETQYLLQSQKNAEHLTRSIAQYRQGKVAVREIVEEPLPS